MEVSGGEENVEELREQWRSLWRERIDDKVRAEGIAYTDYPKLFVDKGTVIFATKAFKPLNFREILELHRIGDLHKIVPPSPYVGGWGKFIRTVLARRRPSERVRETRRYLDSKKKRQHVKKGGRGWLHI